MVKNIVKKTVKSESPVKIHKERKPRILKEEEKPSETKELVLKPGKYCAAVGRRKTSIARVRISIQKDRVFLVNEKQLNQYFPYSELQGIAQDALVRMGCEDKFSVSARVRGGGLHSQAEAIRHGLSRALVSFNEDFKKRLKKSGFLTRDPRMRERKKFGLKRARRAPQWNKR
jgi:small subunit ribosomal protein S9